MCLISAMAARRSGSVSPALSTSSREVRHARPEVADPAGTEKYRPYIVPAVPQDSAKSLHSCILVRGTFCINYVTRTSWRSYIRFMTSTHCSLQHFTQFFSPAHFVKTLHTHISAPLSVSFPRDAAFPSWADRDLQRAAAAAVCMFGCQRPLEICRACKRGPDCHWKHSLNLDE